MIGKRGARAMVLIAAFGMAVHAGWSQASPLLGLIVFVISLIEAAIVMWVIRRLADRWRPRPADPVVLAPQGRKRRQALPRFKSLNTPTLPEQRRAGVDDWVPAGWDLPAYERSTPGSD